jgi:phosphatidylinositol-3-phosphatase
VAYNHYSLLRSIEDLFELEHLGYAGRKGLATFGKDVWR